VAKRPSRYPAEVRPLMDCLRCASHYMRPGLREERRPPRDPGDADTVVWVCPAGHVLVRLTPPGAGGAA
jgi:hypothetical protein